MKFTKSKFKLILFIICDSFCTLWRYYRTLFKSSATESLNDSLSLERRNDDDN